MQTVCVQGVLLTSAVNRQSQQAEEARKVQRHSVCCICTKSHTFIHTLQVALGILERTGYSEVTTVVDGQQAVDKLHRRGGADAFDIILTDLHMPHKV